MEILSPIQGSRCKGKKVVLCPCASRFQLMMGLDTTQTMSILNMPRRTFFHIYYENIFNVFYNSHVYVFHYLSTEYFVPTVFNIEIQIIVISDITY